MEKKSTQKISSAELSTFCGQVALILEAGLPLYDGMETLAGTQSSGENRELYATVSKGVTETGSLYEALKDDGHWPEYLVEMIRIGEQSGQLEKVMRGLEVYYAREERIRTSIVSAVTYPLVLGVMLAAIVLILLWRVLPVFNRVLDSMGGGLSESGSRLMSIGSTVGWIVLALVILLVAAVVVTLVLLRTKKRDAVLELLQKIFPPYGDLTRRLSASRVASVLSMMLSSGFPMDDVLEMTSHVLTDEKAQKKILQIRENMESGVGFADAMAKADLFDELHERMISMGSATGKEDEVLGKLAELYEEQAEEKIDRIISIIEPTLVALLSIVIGAVLLAVMLPMAGILSSL